jgi:predicted nuclease of predicted toxin-antitoxin system
MNFVVDAQLPSGLCKILAGGGHDAIHTLQLPLQNKTPDRLLNELSFVERRVVVSKDTDFFYSHLLQGRPWKLVMVRIEGTIRAEPA